MTHTRVRFLDGWSHLGDPNYAALDAKYAKIRAENDAKPEDVRRKTSTIENHIAELKKSDRYAEKPVGFVRDFSARPGQEIDIPAELAIKLAAGGIVILVDDRRKVA